MLYDFESEMFGCFSLCHDYPNIDENGNWEIPDDVYIPITRDMTWIEVWHAIAYRMW